MTPDSLRGRTAESAEYDKEHGPVCVDDFIAEYSRRDSGASSLASSTLGDSVWSGGDDASIETVPPAELAPPADDRDARRESRKRRVRERLGRYRRDNSRLEAARGALERRLALATGRLREAEDREAAEQSETIKALGMKLIGQAKTIKQQKDATEEYKVQLEEINKEMSVQGQRSSRRKDEYAKLQDRCDSEMEQKVQLQALLQETHEEMAALKSEAEKDARSIIELEFNLLDLQQKEATLGRVAREASDKMRRISRLQDDLEERDRRNDDAMEELNESRAAAERIKKELESASAEAGELRHRISQLQDELEEKNRQADGMRGNLNEIQVGVETTKKELESASVKAGELRGGHSSCESSEGDETGRIPMRAHSSREAPEGDDADRIRWGDRAHDSEAFEDELRAMKREHEATIRALRSEMAAMCSAYRQESRPRREEIAQLKRRNAECALKLRALERACRSVSAARPGRRSKSSRSNRGRGEAIESNFLKLQALERAFKGAGAAEGEEGTGPRGRAVGAGGGGSTPGRRSKSLHSVDSPNGRFDEAAGAQAAEARLGGATLRLFPSIDRPLSMVPQTVGKSEIFDWGDQGSKEMRQGELPGEC